ncbi:alpha/beta hydrolase [Saccharopolyspora sp. TS4A08]|uniref:Alpha/beta hydrolase n=1 Tax=Saccharopolyspora ipomoeae TaxID=3042027 RepID=A0ABT6PHZ0_9PSEU|nr:alpha/beta hydrolase [Saccharopolyspora sp. TS4A08]MDI2027617.1 alpha/beta hydrolase [Saccharopolyspora sp. TS4A08]
MITAVLAVPAIVPSAAAGPAVEDARDFGTPTRSSGKTCPFVGELPVRLPAVTVPASTVPALPEPSVPSTIHAELCMSEAARARAAAGGAPPAVLLLVHGLTYGTWYWDPPFQPGRYSTVNRLVEHGYATLNIDRVGAGRSGHPLSALITPDAAAETVHQLITRLRGGDVGGTRYPRVGLVGHSYGTAVVWLESALHNDADLVIGTGYSNRFRLEQGVNLLSTMLPAALHPVLPPAPWKADPGYLASRQGTRPQLPFFHEPGTDPAMLDVDDRLQNPMTATEPLALSREYDGTHKGIRIPTFLINGRHDDFACGPGGSSCRTTADVHAAPEELERAGSALADYEAPGFHPHACLRAAVIPDAGHNTALHRNSHQTSDTIAHFADQALGTTGANAAPYRATCTARPSTAADTLPDLTRLIPDLLPP